MRDTGDDRQFLSSNAQDFIEDPPLATVTASRPAFLSSNAQDFIEESSAADMSSSPWNS